jgi:hypothetical protein
MIALVEPRLCPKCGAYWRCDCRLEDLSLPSVNCDHDWADAVGVELDESLDGAGSRVVVCRLCGLYAVEARVQ